MGPKMIEAMQWLASNPGMKPAGHVSGRTLRRLYAENLARPDEAFLSAPEEVNWSLSWAGFAMLERENEYKKAG